VYGVRLLDCFCFGTRRHTASLPLSLFYGLSSLLHGSMCVYISRCVHIGFSGRDWQTCPGSDSVCVWPSASSLWRSLLAEGGPGAGETECVHMWMTMLRLYHQIIIYLFPWKRVGDIERSGVCTCV